MSHLLLVYAGFKKYVGQEGIIDLQDQAGIHDRLVFFCQFIRQSEEIFFIRLVILIDADT